MFVKAIRVARNAMFPIFRWDPASNSQGRTYVAGAGFFINRKGYFISVAHLFDNANAQTLFQYRGLIPDKVHNPVANITEVTRDNNHDIYVGRIEIKNPNYFYFSRKKPNIGKSICISGYPLATIQTDAQGVLQVGSVRRYFQPSFVLDNIVINSDVGRVHDGFLIRDFGLFGMSGGPVFDTNATVFGIQGSITPPRESKSASGRSISVENAIAIRSELILDLLRTNKIRFNFLAKF